MSLIFAHVVGLMSASLMTRCNRKVGIHMRRLNNVNSYLVKRNDSEWLVTEKRLRNDLNGNPRSKYYVSILSADWDIPKSVYFSTRVYTLTKHYCGDYEEAEMLVDKIRAEILDKMQKGEC